MFDMLNPDLARVMLAQLLASPDAQANVANTILGYLRDRLGVYSWKIDYEPTELSGMVLDGGDARDLTRFLVDTLCGEVIGERPAIEYHTAGSRTGEFRAVSS